jgi:orotate phosphoribosyltransferase
MAWRKRRAQVRNLAEGLVKAGAFQFGTFTLADGTDTPYYINMKSLPSYPGAFSAVVEAMTSMIRAKMPKVKVVCAVPIAGVALASPIALGLGKPMIYSRISKSTEERVIEGEIKPGSDTVIINDIAISGRSILDTARAVIQEGGEVKHAAVLVDRMEGARERLQKEGIVLHSVVDILELADTLFAMELIDKNNLRSITKSVGGR